MSITLQSVLRKRPLNDIASDQNIHGKSGRCWGAAERTWNHRGEEKPGPRDRKIHKGNTPHTHTHTLTKVKKPSKQGNIFSHSLFIERSFMVLSKLVYICPFSSELLVTELILTGCQASCRNCSRRPWAESLTSKK